MVQSTENELIAQVKLAINPEFQNWVLFSNGTYVILETVEENEDIAKTATNLMKEYGPVFTGSPAGDFNVIILSGTEGWVISGHCPVMYTYVSPKELEMNNPEDIEIGLYGRNKRDRDGKKLEIIYVNQA